MEQPCGLFHPENPRRGIVAEAPPVAEKARRGWRSGQNLPALQAWQILGTARGRSARRFPRRGKTKTNSGQGHTCPHCFERTLNSWE